MFHRRKYLEAILALIDTDDIILLYGSRQVGKTSLMKMIQKDFIQGKSAFLDLENKEYLHLLNTSIENTIEYLKVYFWMREEEKFYFFIDEIQYLDNPTSFLKLIHDHYPNIKTIVSGSSTLEIRWKMKDSLAGRIVKFEIFPLDYEEFLRFRGKDNLADLVWKMSNLDLINNEMKFYFEEFVIWGWYPKVVLSADAELKKMYLEQIFALYIQKDIKDIGKIRETDKFNKLLMIFASQTGNLLNISEISNTINVSKQTVEHWIFLLQNTFVIGILYPFSWNIRSEITKMPKLYFIDTGIRNFIIQNFSMDGAIFENALLSFLRWKNKKIHFWRTIDKKEIDFIQDGIPFEAKLNYDGKKLTALEYFMEKYKKTWNIITLDKAPQSPYTQFFPWEIKISQK